MLYEPLDANFDTAAGALCAGEASSVRGGKIQFRHPTRLEFLNIRGYNFMGRDEKWFGG